VQHDPIIAAQLDTKGSFRPLRTSAMTIRHSGQNAPAYNATCWKESVLLMEHLLGAGCSMIWNMPHPAQKAA